MRAFPTMQPSAEKKKRKPLSTNGVPTWLTLWNHTDARQGQRPRKKFPKLSPDFKYSLLGKMTLSYYRNSTSASPCTKLSSKAWVQQRWQGKVNSKGLFPCGRVTNPDWTHDFRSWEFELPHIHKVTTKASLKSINVLKRITTQTRRGVTMTSS